MEYPRLFVAGALIATAVVLVPAGTHLGLRRRWSRLVAVSAAGVFVLWLAAWVAAAYGAVYVSDCDGCGPPPSAFGSAVWLVLFFGAGALIGLAAAALVGALATSLHALRR